VVCTTLAGVDGRDVELIIVVLGFLAFHGLRHGVVIPELGLRIEAALVMVIYLKTRA
jgi:hypothetical protein